MTLHWHSSQVFSLGNCVDDTPTETGLICRSRVFCSIISLKALCLWSQIQVIPKAGQCISLRLHSTSIFMTSSWNLCLHVPYTSSCVALIQH